MRLHRLIVVAVLGSGSALGVACGLDRGGLLVELDAGDDATVRDVVIPDVAIDIPLVDVYVPPPCTTLDASCLPAFPTDAWAPIALAVDAAACPVDPDAGWATIPLKANPQLVPGSCSCACSATAAPCAPEGGLSFGYNPSCNNSPTALTLPINTCVDNATPAGNVTAAYGPPTAPTTCDASSTGDAQVQTVPVTACASPSCAIDYCGLGSKGYRLCLLQSGNQTCPPGFPQKRLTGLAAGASCLPCGCGAQPTTCTPTLEAFGSAGCVNKVEAYPTDGACTSNALSSSMKLTVVQGTATCDASAGAGIANLNQFQTVCCPP